MLDVYWVSGLNSHIFSTDKHFFHPSHTASPTALLHSPSQPTNTLLLLNYFTVPLALVRDVYDVKDRSCMSWWTWRRAHNAETCDLLLQLVVSLSNRATQEENTLKFLSTSLKTSIIPHLQHLPTRPDTSSAVVWFNCVFQMNMQALRRHSVILNWFLDQYGSVLSQCCHLGALHSFMLVTDGNTKQANLLTN